MKELIEKIERKNNELQIIKTKIGFPLLYSHSQSETELLVLNNQLTDLEIQAALQTKIQIQKKLIIDQLSEYIKTIEKSEQYKFSIKQGLGFKYFYLAPLINIKQISFFTQKGIATVNYNLTLDENDSVTNKEPFVDFLKTKKTEATGIYNLLELYKFYKSFAQNTKIFT